MINLANITDALHPHNRWKLGGVESLYVFKPGRGVFVLEYILSKEDLSEWHPDFYDAVCALLAYVEQESQTTFCEGPSIAANLHVLQHGLVQFNDVMRRPRLMTNLTSMRITDNGETVWLDGNVVTKRTCIVDAMSRSFVTGHPETCVAKAAELDSCYPGWRERWAAGGDLGIEKQELLRMVFTKPATPVASMDDIGFV